MILSIKHQIYKISILALLKQDPTSNFATESTCLLLAIVT
jgi:hypothetical protein